MELFRILAGVTLPASVVLAIYMIFWVVPMLLDRYESLTQLGGYTP